MDSRIALAIGIVVLLVGLAALVPGLQRYCPSCVVERSPYPFTVMMVAYTTYAGLAAGIVMAVSLARLAGRLDEKWMSHAYWAALGLLIAAWITVFLDLGRPDHAVWLVEGWHPTSRVAWMPVFYILLLIPLLTVLVGCIRESRVCSNGVAVGAALLTAALLELNLGSVFGFAVGVPAWQGLYPALSFLVAGVAGGAAAAALLVPLGAKLHGSGSDTAKAVRPLAGIAFAGALLELILEYWRGLQAGYYPGVEAYFSLAGSSIWVEAGLLVAALIVLAAAYARRSYWALVLGSLLLIAGVVAGKYGFIIHGEEARIEAQTFTPVNPYNVLYGGEHYSISGADAAAVAAALLIGLGVFMIGEPLLALEPGEKPRLLFFRSAGGVEAKR
ncbi:hypothetical protein CF15_07125 [Pyrodictium occultum]|uniref:Polysulfide reductase n=1 Tax=Pyrodictium occultum TaxID=2309 RepID=A0A0V8RWQ1_PYROC|nr:NrfD/PsrC family molybdoenzyme membrane anchor subunit [Pyrodictium occultum]KSW12486.1 hypothetical protein CF15_07125 [Pyrodictium occultum]